MLVEHGIDDVNERLVARKEPVTPCEQVPFEPAFALVLAQHFHDAAVRRDVVVAWQDRGGGTPIRHLEHRVPPIRRRFVRAEHPEVVRVLCDDVANELALNAGGLGVDGARLRHRHGVRAEVRQPQVAQQKAAVGVRIGTHAPLPCRRQCR